MCLFVCQVWSVELLIAVWLVFRWCVDDRRCTIDVAPPSVHVEAGEASDASGEGVRARAATRHWYLVPKGRRSRQASNAVISHLQPPVQLLLSAFHTSNKRKWPVSAPRLGAHPLDDVAFEGVYLLATQLAISKPCFTNSLLIPSKPSKLKCFVVF
jgi:hypothetical protein